MLDEDFHGFHGGKLGELFAEDVDAGEFFGVVEEVFAPGARVEDVDGGEDAFFDEFAGEVELHVAGAFEFLEDDFVHAAVGVHKGGGNNGEAAAFFDVASCPEEFLGGKEGFGVHAAAHDAAFIGHEVVVAAGEPGDAVEHDDDVAAQLDEAFGAFENEFGDLNVARGCESGSFPWIR